MKKDILNIQNVTKTFAGVKALNNVSLSVKRGEVHALMGENGAGKSTLIKILTGIYKADSGEIILMGKHGISTMRLRRSTRGSARFTRS